MNVVAYNESTKRVGTVAALGRLVFKTCTEQVAFEQRPEGRERASQVDNRKKTVPDRGNQCKGPEVGACLVCFKISKRTSEA